VISIGWSRPQLQSFTDLICKLYNEDCLKDLSSFISLNPRFPIDIPIFYSGTYALYAGLYATLSDSDDDASAHTTFADLADWGPNLFCICLYFSREQCLSFLLSKGANLNFKTRKGDVYYYNRSKNAKKNC